MRHQLLATISLATLASCSHSAPQTQPAPAPTPAVTNASYSTGADVLTAMHERYAGKWYSTLTFTQKTSRLGAGDKWNVSTWFEALQLPGTLRIDFDTTGAGSGVLYMRDSAFTIQNGRPITPQKAINPLLVLGFDIYAQPVARSAAILKGEGFDLARVHMASFENRPMIVVGARDGEARRKQFWIDAEHLYFVRMIDVNARDTTKIQDTRFVNYRREGGAWLSPRVEVYSDGKLIFTEEYSNIKTNVALDPALFDPTKWKATKNWMVH